MKHKLKKINREIELNSFKSHQIRKEKSEMFFKWMREKFGSVHAFSRRMEMGPNAVFYWRSKGEKPHPSNLKKLTNLIKEVESDPFDGSEWFK